MPKHDLATERNVARTPPGWASNASLLLFILFPLSLSLLRDACTQRERKRIGIMHTQEREGTKRVDESRVCGGGAPGNRIRADRGDPRRFRVTRAASTPVYTVYIYLTSRCEITEVANNKLNFSLLLT